MRVRGYGLSKSVICLTFTMVAARSAFAEADFKPNWFDAQTQLSPNASYLSDFSETYTQSDSRQARETQAKIFDPRVTRDLKQQYEDMMRDYEFRKNYDLVGQQEEMDRNKDKKNFGKFFLRSLFSFHVTEEVNNTAKRSDEIRTFKNIHDTVQTVIQKGVNVNVVEGVKFGSKADVPKQSGAVWMTSPFLNARVDMRLGALEERDPLAVQNPAQPRDLEDRYVVSASKPLPLNVNSGITYGTASTNMTSYLSRPITDNLTCVVDHSKALNNSHSSKQTEETARLNYSIRF